jgi:hypothetical protein
LNDHTVPATQFPGQFRQNILFTDNYAVNCGAGNGEGFYLGPNGDDGDVPLKDMEVSYNLVVTPSRDCFNLKLIYSGANSLHHNYSESCGVQGDANQDSGIEYQNGGNVEIYSNIWIEPSGRCISFVQSVPPGGFSRYVRVFNNLCIRPGAGPSVNNEAFSFNRQPSGFDYSPLLIYNNTVIDPTGVCVAGNSNVAGGEIRDNILADCTVSSGTWSVGNNKTGTTASQGFVNAGSDDYHLTSGSAARNAQTGGAPLDDLDGTTRPQQGTSDQGAYEYVPP